VGCDFHRVLLFDVSNSLGISCAPSGSLFAVLSSLLQYVEAGA
jgi:hypothetical protein